jgi:hypothetical protein
MLDRMTSTTGGIDSVISSASWKVVPESYNESAESWVQIGRRSALHGGYLSILAYEDKICRKQFIYSPRLNPR